VIFMGSEWILNGMYGILWSFKRGTLLIHHRILWYSFSDKPMDLPSGTETWQLDIPKHGGVQ
jgi:hypothetical protein